MAQFQWQFDAPTGVYKQHALSSRLYEAALAESKFVEHVRPIEGYGKNKGETITITRVKNITEPTSPVLDEGTRISEDSFVINTVNLTVQEIGRAVPYTSLSLDLSEFDLENPIQKKLKAQMTLSLDTLCAAAFKGCQIAYTPTSLTAGTFDTDGTTSTTATANMNVFHVEEIADYLYDTLMCPPAVDDDYIGIFRRLGIRGIKRDPSWEEWHKYSDPQAKFNGEVGRIERVRFVETNHSNALAKKGTSSVLGEGVVFGEDAVVMAEALTPELRAAMPDDFGRSKAVAWYGILVFDEIWNTSNAGEARIVHVDSA